MSFWEGVAQQMVATFATNIVLWIIGKIATASYTQDVTHAVWERCRRRGARSAIASAIRALPGAFATLAARTTNPFVGLAWEDVFDTTPGFSKYPSLFDARKLGSSYYVVNRDDGKDGFAGGVPLLSHPAIGFDRASRKWLAAISLHCGGTASCRTIIVYAWGNAGSPEYVGALLQGDKQGAFFANGALHVSTPVRDRDEPNCSWRRTRVASYALRGHQMVKNRESILTTEQFRRTYQRDLKPWLRRSRSQGLLTG